MKHHTAATIALDAPLLWICEYDVGIKYAVPLVFLSVSEQSEPGNKGSKTVPGKEWDWLFHNYDTDAQAV